MIVDSSAIIAILMGEAETAVFAGVLDTADVLRVSAATFVELSIVVDRWKNPTLSNQIEELITRFNISIEPVTVEQARIARQAHRDFGRGSGHPAKLNFGDCFSYALARDKREPLLFKGDDFIHTDVRPAVS